MEACNKGLEPITAVSINVQPFVPVTVQIKFPNPRLEIVAVVPPLDHK